MPPDLHGARIVSGAAGAVSQTRRKRPVPSSSVVLHLTLDRGPLLAGVVVSDDGVGPLPFSGWLGLVEAVDICRRLLPTELTGTDAARQEEERPGH